MKLMTFGILLCIVLASQTLANSYGISNTIITPNSYTAPLGQYPSSYDQTTGITSFTNMPSAGPANSLSGFDAVIYTKDSVHLFANYSSEFNLSNDQSTDFTTLMNDIQNKLPSGSSIKIKSGIFGMNSDLTLLKSYDIWCDKISPLSLSPSQGTRIYTNNYTITQTQEFSETHDCFLDGVVNHHKDVYDVKAAGVRDYDDVIKASSDSIPLHYIGNSTYNTGNDIFSGLLLNGNPSLKFDGFVSQSNFPYLQIQSFTKNAIVFHNADDVYFGQVEITQQTDTGGNAVVIGTSGTDQSYAEHFNYLSVTCNSCNPVQINTNPGIGFDQTIIDDFGSSDLSHINYTNNGYGNVIIKSDTPAFKYFTVITPAIPPVNTTIQNTNSAPVIIYQTGGSGITVTDINNISKNLGNPTTIYLDPGFKIKFNTIPTSWIWDER